MTARAAALSIAVAAALAAATASAQDGLNQDGRNNERYRWRAPPPAQADTDAPGPSAGALVKGGAPVERPNGVNELPDITIQAAPRRVTGEKARARRLVLDGRRPLSSNIPGSRDVLFNLRFYFLESPDRGRLDCNGQPARVVDVALDGVHPYEGVAAVADDSRTADSGAAGIRYHRAIAYFRGTVDPIDRPVCGGETEIAAELLLVRLIDNSLGDSWFAPAWRRALVQQ